MVQLDKCVICLLILMAAVNWDATEKVMDTGTVTLSMMPYKVLCCLRKKFLQSKSLEYLHFQKFQPFFPKCTLKHQYL